MDSLGCQRNSAKGQEHLYVHDRAPSVVAPRARVSVAVVASGVFAAILRDACVIFLQAWVRLAVLVDGGRVVAAVVVEDEHGLELFGYVRGVLGQRGEHVTPFEAAGGNGTRVHGHKGSEKGNSLMGEIGVHLVGLGFRVEI